MKSQQRKFQQQKFGKLGMPRDKNIYNLDKTKIPILGDSEQFLVWHFVGFVLYQVFHHFIAISMSGFYDDFLPLLVVGEAIQAYLVLLYHWNTKVTYHQNSSEQASLVNTEQDKNHKLKGDTLKCSFAFCTFFIMVAYQLIVSIRIASTYISHKHHICWVRWEMAQLLLSVMWLFNPFYTSCPEEYFLPGIIAKYTFNYQYVAFSIFLFTSMINCYVYFKMSQIAKYKKRLRNVILYQQSVKYGGISYKTWVYFIFVLLLIPLLSVPIAWYLDELEYDRSLTFKDLWDDDNFKMEFRIVFLLWCFMWIQLLHISLFGCFAFSNFDMAGLFSLEIANLLLTFVVSSIWFFPNLVGFQIFVDYFSKKYPRTSDALTMSLIIFLVLVLTLLLLSIEIGNPDPKKIDDYEVLDGENTSSTKKGAYEHPFYLNRKNIPEMENLRKRK
ncbi:hypothetical protein L5515_009080 [Caenorhabditis briggsae]|uniref:Transmembrane protein n=1 Tax=Caenorhabditis briggsae TaxID=6238 RepID=A0AAE9F7X4_CAEBR|nr:hypothetical protein L5515_009080 [Caenorhabditis briggsae]